MTLKYLNLNIWMGKLLEPALKFLKEQDADIVCLQEVLDSNEKDAPKEHYLKDLLIKELPYKHHVYYPLALDARFKPPAFFGNIILSKFPLSNVRSEHFDRPFTTWVKFDSYEDFPRGILSAQADLGEGKSLNVFNVHGIWGKHGDDTERRLNMIDTILHFMGDKSPSILSGDFNLNENVYPELDGKPDLSKPRRTKSVAKLEEKLVNVFKDERINSFNMKYKDPNTSYSVAVVDMVYVTPDIKVLSHVQPETEVSDHRPQVVEISL